MSTADVESPAFFSSDRERRLWLWTAAVVVAIYSTLGLVQTLAGVLRDRNMLDATFFYAFLVILGAIVIQSIKSRRGRLEIGILLAVGAVYLMVFLRMALPEERTHLIEYSVVGLLVLEALRERAANGYRVPRPALLALGVTTLLGIIDEVIQFFLPNRVFDPIDIGFNTLAAIMAIGASVALVWARDRTKAAWRGVRSGS